MYIVSLIEFIFGLGWQRFCQVVLEFEVGVVLIITRAD